MGALARGDLTVEIEGAARRDEVGEMAQAVQVFKANALDQARIEAEAVAARQATEAERKKASAERAAAAAEVSSAMDALRAGMKRLADGNLLVRLNEGFAPQFAQVRDDFNAAASRLRKTLSAVAATTGVIKTSTHEIHSASDDLAQRTETQAASIVETASALEEITATVKESAKGAQHAAEVAAVADANAKKGAVVVRKAMDAMDAIAGSSTKIGQIIGVIDEIAFQTNLLALNAGVEAARAGDSGRGFAVVAMEVRALAQRSASAAKEIKGLVTESGAQVSAGVKLVADTGKALEVIITEVSEINNIVGNIANGAMQQAAGLDQINAAMNQMDATTHQNAEMVQESNAVSNSMSREMTELTRLVDQFQVSDSGENDLRRNLQAAVPHAFNAPAAARPPGRRLEAI